MNRITGSPAFNVALFALLLNFPWEFLQVPFFAEMPSMEHWQAVRFCAQATLGDVLIALGAYWIVAMLRRDRDWILNRTGFCGGHFV